MDELVRQRFADVEQIGHFGHRQEQLVFGHEQRWAA
jgi:hypothetical protein